MVWVRREDRNLGVRLCTLSLPPLAMALPSLAHRKSMRGKGLHPVIRRIADGPNQRDRGTPTPVSCPHHHSLHRPQREGERALLRVPSPVLVHPPRSSLPRLSSFNVHPTPIGTRRRGPAIQPSTFQFNYLLPLPYLEREREREAVTRPRNLAFPPRGPSLSRAPTPHKLRVHFQPQSSGSRLGHAPRRDNWQSYRIIHRLPTLHAKSETGGDCALRMVNGSVRGCRDTSRRRTGSNPSPVRTRSGEKRPSRIVRTGPMVRTVPSLYPLSKKAQSTVGFPIATIA